MNIPKPTLFLTNFPDSIHSTQMKIMYEREKIKDFSFLWAFYVKIYFSTQMWCRETKQIN